MCDSSTLCETSLQKKVIPTQHQTAIMFVRQFTESILLVLLPKSKAKPEGRGRYIQSYQQDLEKRVNTNTERPAQKTALNRTRPAWEINRKHMSRTDGHTDQRTEERAPQSLVTCLVWAEHWNKAVFSYTWCDCKHWDVLGQQSNHYQHLYYYWGHNIHIVQILQSVALCSFVRSSNGPAQPKLGLTFSLVELLVEVCAALLFQFHTGLLPHNFILLCTLSLTHYPTPPTPTEILITPSATRIYWNLYALARRENKTHMSLIYCINLNNFECSCWWHELKLSFNKRLDIRIPVTLKRHSLITDHHNLDLSSETKKEMFLKVLLRPNVLLTMSVSLAKDKWSSCNVLNMFFIWICITERNTFHSKDPDQPIVFLWTVGQMKV